jgi:hypothetical protein
MEKLGMVTKARKSIRHTLEEQRQESDEEHQEDRDDTPLNPVKDRNKVITSCSLLTAQHVALRVYLTDRQFLVQSSNVQHCGA